MKTNTYIINRAVRTSSPFEVRRFFYARSLRKPEGRDEPR